MAIWIRTTDVAASQNVTPANGKSFTLEEMQRYVGGYIEALPLDNGDVMWLNEEGKLNGLPYNSEADLIAHKHSGIQLHDTIVGDVLIASRIEAGEDEEEG